MVFSSIPFLYYFLPCVLLAYFLIPKNAKNIVLLLASLLFYAWGEPMYVFLMLLSVGIGYVSGLALEKSRNGKFNGMKSKTVLMISIAIFLGIFVYFKYTDFFISNFNAVTGLSVPLLHIVLPVGISFYTFQIVSYLIDVYRGDTPAQKNFISLATYITMFPQLIAGPIVRYTDIEKQLKHRGSTFSAIENGMFRFVIGLSKKILIANELGALCELFRNSGEQSVLYYWLYAVAFALHIYFDFSGYSDMAIGLGRILGFTFPENFNYPYIAGSITEFWRRWHISLGSWFRDYLYIPLGGNRVSKIKWYRNIFIVWLFTGFWHGASWNFVIWGLYFGVLLVLEKKWLLPLLNKGKVWQHVYVLLLIVISFVIFNATDMPQAMEDIRCMFGMGGLPLVSTEAVYYLRSFGLTLLFAILGATPLPVKAWKVLQVKQQNKHNVVAWLLQGMKIAGIAFLLLLCTAYLVDGSFNPFLYFRF